MFVLRRLECKMSTYEKFNYYQLDSLAHICYILVCLNVIVEVDTMSHFDRMMFNCCDSCKVYKTSCKCKDENG